MQSMGTGTNVLRPMFSLAKRQAVMALFPMALAGEIEVAPYQLI